MVLLGAEQRTRRKLEDDIACTENDEEVFRRALNHAVGTAAVLITKKLQSGAEACDQDDGEHEQDGGDGVDKCECDGHEIPRWLEAATTQVNKGPTQTLFFPWPPSTNDLWRACKGRNILSARYRSWKGCRDEGADDPEAKLGTSINSDRQQPLATLHRGAIFSLDRSIGGFSNHRMAGVMSLHARWQLIGATRRLRKAVR